MDVLRFPTESLAQITQQIVSPAWIELVVRVKLEYSGFVENSK
jgi:hypothetical protein